MTLGSTIKQFMDNFARALAISSANPTKTNRVKEVDFFGESGNFDDILRQDVIQIIKDEISLQLTEFREPTVKPSTPTGSSQAQIVSNVKKGIGTATNPASIATDLMKFLPHTALVAFAISLAPMIIDEITKDGGLMDTRWKRIMEKEQNAFIDRQTQKNIQIGTKQLIVKTRSGFTAINPALNYNNYREIRDGGVDGNRLAKIDITDHTKGLWN